MTDLEGRPDIVLVWPDGREPPDERPAPGYRIRTHAEDAADDDRWIAIHRRAVPKWSVEQIRGWLETYRRLALPNGILFAEHAGTGEAVATAGGLVNPEHWLFPGAGQVGWVATDPAHRRRGLARWLCARVTARLLAETPSPVFLITGDVLVPAVRLYLEMGYVPHLYAGDQAERWARLREQVEAAGA